MPTKNKKIKQVGKRLLHDYYLIERQRLIESIAQTTLVQKQFLLHIQQKQKQLENDGQKSASLSINDGADDKLKSEESSKSDEVEPDATEQYRQRCIQYIAQFSIIVQYFYQTLSVDGTSGGGSKSHEKRKSGDVGQYREMKKTKHEQEEKVPILTKLHDDDDIQSDFSLYSATSNILYLALEKLEPQVTEFLTLFPRYLKLKLTLFGYTDPVAEQRHQQHQQEHQQENEDNQQPSTSMTNEHNVSSWLLLMASVANMELTRTLKRFMKTFVQEFTELVLSQFSKDVVQPDEEHTHHIIHFKDLLTLQHRFIRCYFVTFLSLVWSSI